MSYRDEIILEIETVKDIVADEPELAGEYAELIQKLETKLKELN